MGEAYLWLIDAFEVLAVLVLTSCVVFLLRRNVVRVKRLNTSDLKGWPRRDANIILITEIILMALFLTMDATDGGFLISKYIHVPQEVAINKTCWWLHIIGVLAFLNYLPYSKHFHIILGFPNTYYADITPPGEMENMPTVQKEVEYVFHPENAPTEPTEQHFGAKDIFDLKKSQLLQAYSCTECGRCTAACPANQTGKKLSPRKIMMDTRDRMEQLSKNKDDKQTLLHGYITPEELRACTTCNACVQECPVSISPLSIILELRRALVMEESSAPPEWNSMFSNIENNFAPWKFSPDDRGAWAQNP
jgi:heterodisulfide reductase subunit C